MAHYLVPVDFSPVSVNAVRYMLDSTLVSDQIDLCHVSTGMVSLAEPPIVQNYQQHEAATREKMGVYFANALGLQSLPERCTLLAETGEIVSTIVHQSKNFASYDQIVLGTRDKYDIFDRWLGTISLGVVKRSDIPVMLIPPKATYEPIVACVVAGDVHLTDQDNLDKISAWNTPLTSFLHFVHVAKESTQQYQESLELIIKNYFEKNTVKFGYDISRVESAHITATLMEEASRHGAQLIVVLPDKQSFLQALLVKSISKELILRSSTPLLFLK